MDLQLTSCLECGRPAEVAGRVSVDSTDGPVQLVKIRCVTGPWFLTPDPPGPPGGPPAPC